MKEQQAIARWPFLILFISAVLILISLWNQSSNTIMMGLQENWRITLQNDASNSNAKLTERFVHQTVYYTHGTLLPDGIKVRGAQTVREAFIAASKSVELDVTREFKPHGLFGYTESQSFFYNFPRWRTISFTIDPDEKNFTWYELLVVSRIWNHIGELYKVTCFDPIDWKSCNKTLISNPKVEVYPDSQGSFSSLGIFRSDDIRVDVKL